MIDFSNATFFKLRQVENSEFSSALRPLLARGETILKSYKAVRDGVIFTNYRIIAMNAQGVTGTKKDFTSLPYSKIQAYSVETSGVFDYDCELELWFSGLGKVRFEFIYTTNISEVCDIISERVLDIPHDILPIQHQNENVKAETVPEASDITPEEPKLKTSAAQFCPYCYRMLDGDPEFCPKCKKRLK